MVVSSYDAEQFLHFAALVGQEFDGDASFPPLMQVSRSHGIEHNRISVETQSNAKSQSNTIESQSNKSTRIQPFV